MDWKDLGEAISEAIALKQKGIAIQGNIDACDSDIASNEREIAKRKVLEADVEKLKGKKKDLVTEKATIDSELGKRMAKLEKAGVSLPESAPGGGVVNL